MTFIDPRGKVFAHLDRVVAWQRGDTPAPVTVEWDLSNRCVLGCQDCHFAHTHVRGPWAVKDRRLPMAFDSTGDVADLQLLDRGLSEMRAAGVQGLVWSGGGEPTTHPQYIEAIRLAEVHGLRQGMYTLGGLLKQPEALYLAHLLQWIVVSLDAPDAETYADEKHVPPGRFHDACYAVRWLSAPQKAVVGVSFLLHGQNAHRAADMLALARSLGATYTTFRPAIRTRADQPSVCDDDRRWIRAALDRTYWTTLQRLADEPDVEIDLERFRAYADWSGHGYRECRGIQLNTTITPDGRVWVCPQRRGVAGSCLGDLRSESFAAIWARHPGHFTVDAGCRVMCRLHPVNETLAALSASRAHEAFI